MVVSVINPKLLNALSKLTRAAPPDREPVTVGLAIAVALKNPAVDPVCLSAEVKVAGL